MDNFTAAVRVPFGMPAHAAASRTCGSVPFAAGVQGSGLPMGGTRLDAQDVLADVRVRVETVSGPATKATGSAITISGARGPAVRGRPV